MLYSVIVADDQKIIRKCVAKFIHEADSDFDIVGEFDNGADVIEYIKKHDVDVIFTDIIMYDTSGIDIAEYVFRNKLKTRVVIISAYKEFEFARSAVSYGVKDYLIKPTSTNEIRRVLKSLKEEFENISENININEFSDAILFEKTEDNDKNADIVRKALKYIGQNYEKNISVSDVAKHVYLNEDYFGKIFKKSVGMSFSGYLTKIRMDEAIRLIKTGKYKIYQISEKVGYNNCNYFIKAFKNVFGCTPKEYIHKNGVKND